MYEAPINLSEDTPSDLLARIMTYIGAAFRFQRSWALPAQAGEPPRLLAFERRALSRMVSRAEHMIRCWIILLAFAHIRDDTAPARRWTLPVSVQAGKRQPISFAEREILARRKPEPPAFRISLPSIREMGKRAFDRSRTGHPKRHSEQIEAALDMRLKRLFTLLDEADDRARNIAAIWKGRIRSIRKTPPTRRPHFDPLKGAAAPGALLETAEEDEARTVRQFHLIAHTAVQGVYALCGRQCS
ncbi:hypothetical protein [Ponticaulis sp.]|uniref:hypothetical protein n=1 Tax=Ponticaulis sp. TaxID=2020902 RepID=UPI000B706419|nr:hypothetical protein [Ponticaulis sp.]MAJ07810.1 hypothetical protein [Ponticaulis sp.]RPG18130.1 MAG: hypothetical protein CBC85_002540 [Hyphomonadaceae bacterium TMED125]HBH90507.1 hypothetical protein [Hyphomonadaceae bacterium]HBJ93559.1 hypothetical protein [Hyphomonadaceae bacterium]|tara:strand:+ start:21433 stop:22164 length:732 start_codon:yes stop_codon:yes gene_type:complete